MVSSVLALGLLLGPAIFGAFRLEQYVGLATTRATRILAISIISVAQIQTVALVAGSVGFLSRVPLLTANLVVGAVFGLLPALRPQAPRTVPETPLPSHRAPWWIRVGSLALAGFAVARWAATSIYVTKVGFQDFDTLEYHLPIAARFVQLHAVTQLQPVYPELPITFYPLNGELFYAVTLGVARSSVWIAFFNVVWLALLMLAAWSIGRRYRVEYLAVAGVAMLAATPLLVDSFAGTAMVDVFAIAMFLAGTALVVTEGFRPWALFAGGLGAGISAGAKYPTLLAAGALTVALVIWLVRTARSRQILYWAAGLTLTGSYWYGRNLLEAGSPLPEIHLSAGAVGLPHADMSMPQAMSILHYLGQPAVLIQIVTNLTSDFGPLAYVLLLAVAAGIVLSAASGTDAWARVLGSIAAVCALGYLAIPSTAYGPPGRPEMWQATDYNVRYALPALVLGILLLPAARVFASTTLQATLLGVFALIVLAFQRNGSTLVTHLSGASLVPGIIVAGLLGTIIWVCRLVPSDHRRTAALSGLCAGTGLAVALAPAVGVRWQHRYQPVTAATTPYTRLYQWASHVSHSRIGTVGLSFYPLYGRGQTNTVTYVGWLGPSDALHDYPSCSSFLDGVANGHYRYLVLQDSNPPYNPVPPAEKWAIKDPGLTVILRSPGQTVFRVSGPVSAQFCGPSRPYLASDATTARGGA